jgi:hypothetical protein
MHRMAWRSVETDTSDKPTAYLSDFTSSAMAPTHLFDLPRPVTQAIVEAHTVHPSRCKEASHAL